MIIMEWKTEFSSYEKQNTMPLDRAKIEAQREIAEQLDRLNKNMETLIASLKVDVFAVELEKLNNNLENINFNMVKE